MVKLTLSGSRNLINEPKGRQMDVIDSSLWMDITPTIPVKTSFTLRENSESCSYLVTFVTWLHYVWCALVSIVLGVLKLVGRLGKVGGAWLSCKANQQGIKMRGLLRGGIKECRES